MLSTGLHMWSNSQGSSFCIAEEGHQDEKLARDAGMHGTNELGPPEDKINSVMNYNSKAKDGPQTEVEATQCVAVRASAEVASCMSEGHCSSQKSNVDVLLLYSHIWHTSSTRPVRSHALVGITPCAIEVLSGPTRQDVRVNSETFVRHSGSQVCNLRSSLSTSTEPQSHWKSTRVRKNTYNQLGLHIK